MDRRRWWFEVSIQLPVRAFDGIELPREMIRGGVSVDSAAILGLGDHTRKLAGPAE